MTSMYCPVGCDQDCKLCRAHRFVEEDNDELAKNRLLSREACHPLLPQSGVWVSYSNDWASFVIWATEYEAMRYALAENMTVGYLYYGHLHTMAMGDLPREKAL